MDDKKNELHTISKSFDLSAINSDNLTKIMEDQFNTPQIKKTIKDLKAIEIPKLDFNFDSYNCNFNKVMDEIYESNRKKEMQKQDFFNHTKIIAESNVALTKSNEQIVKTNEQLLTYNEMLVQQNQILVNQLKGMNSKLNELSDEIVPCSKVQEILGLEHSDKLDEIIELLNNPKDKNLMDKIGNSFTDVPPQVLIGLVVEGLKVYFGFGS